MSRTVGTARTDFWYDITGLTLETGAASSTVLRDPKGRLLSLSSGTMFANFGRDRLGSVTALVGTNQALTATYNYKPYQYTGTYLDTATGSYQMGARYYERKLGRFSQLDPLPKNLISVNRYAYVGCNPTNFTDPTGLDVIDACLDNALPSLVGGAAIGAVGGFAAGSFGGPAGSVAGTVGGVIAGGILGAAEGCIEGTVEYLIS